MEKLSQKQRFEALPWPLQDQAKRSTAAVIAVSIDVVVGAIGWVLEERMPHTATPYMDDEEEAG